MRKVKIAVNTRLLLTDKLEGIGWFAYETLKRITKAHPQIEFVFVFDRKYDERFIFSNNITPVVIGPQARHPFLFYQWFEHSIPKILQQYNADVFLSPDGYLSLKTDVASIGVIHDLNFEHYPKDLPWLVRKYYKYYFPKFAEKATRITTVSQFSKEDIVKQYNIAAEKIDVVYNGCNELYTPVDDTVKQKTKAKFSNNADYFLFIGALHPRKNLVNLFKAFDQFKNKGSETKLLIVGEKKWWTTDIETTYNNIKCKEDVVFTGRLQPEELHKVLASALALTYVSYFEGFGIPILEAMKCDVPVITANVTSMPEVAGGAALLVDPFSVSSIANAMEEVQENPTKRKELIEKGRVHSQQFSWDKTADLLWGAIEKTISN